MGGSREAHIFVVGDDDFNQQRLSRLEAEHPWRFHRVLDYEASQDTAEPIREKLEAAVRLIDDTGAPVSGITSYWDFPQMAMVSVLAERYGVPAPRLESLVRCQHKFYSRVEQRKAVPDLIPGFTAVDPKAHRLEDLELEPPFWLKPVRAHSSQLGFKIESQRDYDHAIRIIARSIDEFATATNEVLRMSRLPEELAHVHGGWCVAEELISGGDCVQLTAEGFVPAGGDPVVYGIVDSFQVPGGSSFERYQYPSSLPDEVKARVKDGCARFMKHVRFEAGAFNIEFFWDRKTDRLSLLEVNARTSQSHADLFKWVDGTSNVECAVRLALGEHPPGPHHDGEHAIAAKFFHRSFRDARVRRTPTDDEVARIEREVPGVKIQIPPRGKRKLSDMLDQDSYSFELALVHVGGESQGDIEDKFRRVVDRLHYELEDLDDGRRLGPEQLQEARA